MTNTAAAAHAGAVTPDELQALIEAARAVEMTDADREAQRRSFVYGNTKIENDQITRKLVDRAAESVAQQTRR